METGTDAIQRTPPTGCGQRPGGANRRQCARPVATRELASSEPCATNCLLRLSWTPGHGRTVLAQSAEPPDADPHVRWCGRGGEVTLPPMPIGPPLPVWGRGSFDFAQGKLRSVPT